MHFMHSPIKYYLFIIKAGLSAALTACLILRTAAAENRLYDKQGRQLSPMGAEIAGNAEGTIPIWDGGITAPPPGYKKGMHHPDPFKEDKAYLRIDRKNFSKYRSKLTQGHQELIQTYPKFLMDVYPSRRSASYPEYVYNACLSNAKKSRLDPETKSVLNAEICVPFPIPKNGLEAIWNHLLRFRGEAVRRSVSQAAVTVNGKYTLAHAHEEFYFLYALRGATFSKINNLILYLRQHFISPPLLAGAHILVHETLDRLTEPRHSWIYTTGQRRVRRAPFIAYDAPASSSDGLRTFDQYDIYNGAPDRYEWKILGKKEMFVPYNSYRLHSDALDYSDILLPQHINTAHARYELHRVWVVEALLKKDSRHVYKRRVFYLDEDSWNALAVDYYDKRDNLWRFSEAHTINYYEVPLVWSTLEVHYDLDAKRYLAMGLDNKSAMYDFDLKEERSNMDYTPSSLRRAGIR